MKKIFFIIILFLLTGCCKNDDLPLPGRIEGKTMDASEVKIPDVKVWVRSYQVDTTIATTYSNSIGFYEFSDILPGTYQIWAWKEDYDTTAYMEVEVFENDTTIRNIKLFFKTY